MQICEQNYEKIWELPLVPPKRGYRWCWWFWLFFIKNKENPERPKQLMILWSFKEASTYIHNFLYTKPPEIITKPTNTDLPGMVAAWYYDGEHLDHDFLLENGTLKVRQNTDEPHKGKVEINNHTFTGEKNKYAVDIKTKDHDMHFNIDLNDINEYSKPLYKENTFVKGIFKYSVTKLNRCDLSGIIDGDDVEGTAYLQKIGLNNPAPPWFWAVMHFDDGSVLKYFFPQVSASLLRRSNKEKPRWTDKLWRPVKREMEFYCAKHDKVYCFNSLSFHKEYNDEQLPVWVGIFKSSEATLSFRLNCYSRALWSFRPGKKKLFPSVLHYNEYPCLAEKVELKTKNETLTLDDFGQGVGNSEHTWGILL